jgi:hypothetical protein
LTYSNVEYARTGDLFYVLGPKDFVVAKPRTVSDHIDWLLARQRYAEALECAQKEEAAGGINLAPHHSVEEIGQMYLVYLFEQGKYVRKL